MLTMPIVTEMKIFGYTQDKKIILENTETCPCPACKQGIMKIRSRVARHSRKEDTGEKVWFLIPVGQCSNKDCRKMARMLPEDMVPYKHYEQQAISDVLDEVITDESPVDYPGTQTMRRWFAWLIKNKDRIEGLLRCVGYRALGFSENLLFSASSLLDDLRRRTDNWLKIIIRFIYNSGYHLLPL